MGCYHEELRNRWSGSGRVEAFSLRKTQSLDKSFAKLASYSFKNSLLFNYKFGGYQWNKEDTDENMFSQLQANTVFNNYASMNGKNNSGLIIGRNSK